MTSSLRKMLLIGWDAADWQFAAPLLAAGQMPNLGSLMQRGVLGDLVSQQPMLSPILWTSIATGKRGDKHGVLSFLEVAPDATDVRPATSTSRKTRAIWNMLTQRGLQAHVIAWYASHPAEPISGVCVSDQFLHINPSKMPAWPLPPDSVLPLDLRESIEQLRVRPAALKIADLLPFVPRLSEIPAGDPRLIAFGRALARTASIQAVTTAVLSGEQWDFLGVYFDMIDVAGHVFMPMHPPAMQNVSATDAALFGEVMRGVYRFHDMILGRLVELAGVDATVMLVSDHGFYSDVRRPLSAGKSEAEQAAAWHNPTGLFAMAGPGVRRNAKIVGASILDVTPTILAALNLPIGDDMDGRALLEVFATPPQLTRIASWDNEPGDAGEHPAEMRADSVESAESIRQLVSLGYLAPVTDDKQALIDLVTRERQFNLALILQQAGKSNRSVDIYEQLVASEPKETRYRIALASALIIVGRRDEAIAALEALRDGLSIEPESQALLAQQLALAGRVDEASAIIDSLTTASMSPRLMQAIGLVLQALGRRDAAEAMLREAVSADPTLHESWYALGSFQFERLDYQGAINCLTRALTRPNGFAAAQRLRAAAHTKLGDNVSAEADLARASALEPSFAMPH